MVGMCGRFWDFWSLYNHLDSILSFPHSQRDYGEHRDPAGYFERYLWPAYRKLEVAALKHERTGTSDVFT